MTEPLFYRKPQQDNDSVKSEQSVEVVPKHPLDHPYLIGDGSTMRQQKSQEMEGLGVHHSTPEDKHVRDYSLVQSLYYVLLR